MAGWRIIRAEPEDRQRWDAYVNQHPDSSAYHLAAWRQAVERAYRFAGVYLMAVRGTDICGVLPMIHCKIPLLAGCLVSLPYCDVGATLADNAEIATSLEQEAIRRARQYDCRQVMLRSSTPSGSEHCVDLNSGDKVRMILDLPPDSEQLLAGLKAKVRSQVKKPVRDGLTCQVGGQDLIELFYRVFARNMRDLGSPVHGMPWIRAVMQCYGDRARIAVVYTSSGVPAAAGLVLMHRSSMAIPWASSLRDYNPQNPNMLLYWTLLKYAIDQGLSRFDFGRSTLNAGSYRFKKQWGAREEPLEWIDLLSAEKRQKPVAGGSALRRFAETGWKCLPVPFSTSIGPLARRYISL